MLAVALVVLRLAAVEPWVQSVDAYAYWSTRTGSFYAASSAGTLGSYLYSPAFAQLLAPIVQLPWPVFVAIWTVLLCATYVWLTGRLALPLLLFLPIPFEIVSGNVHLLYAAVIVLGFRYPAAWALPLLTKVTPGVGLVWFAARREWRALAVAVGVTGAIALASFVLDPGAWTDWVRLLGSSGQPVYTPGWYLPVPLLPRVLAAGVLAAWGGRTDRRWTVPVAVTLALPVLWLNGLATLVALVPILQERAVDPGLFDRGTATGPRRSR